MSQVTPARQEGRLEPAARVISLLPAATEIVGSLDMLDALVGVSHECDYPVEVNGKPRVTRCEIHGSGLPNSEVLGFERPKRRHYRRVFAVVTTPGKPRGTGFSAAFWRVTCE